MAAYPAQGFLKQTIVDRVRAGETVKAICAGDATMPCAETVSIWVRRDPVFAAAMADARRRADWARRFVFDEAKAQAFLVRVAEGERINDLLDTPGMPGKATYRYWRRTQGAFQEALWRLRGARYARHGERMSGSRWARFDPAVADRILVRTARGEGWARFLDADPDLPHRQAADRWRRENPDWGAAMRIAIGMGRRAQGAARTRADCEALSDRIGERIALDGHSLRSLARDPNMPCAQTLYKWTALFPEFARVVADAYEFRAWMEADRRLATDPMYAEMMADLAAKLGQGGGGKVARKANPVAEAVPGVHG